MALQWARRVAMAFGIAGLVLAALVAIDTPALAQSDDAIGSIVVRGNQRIEAATVSSYLTVKVGDPFDDDELDRSLKNLYASSFFEDVALTREGDRLLVEVVENPIINRIAYEGNLRLDDATLEPEVQLRPRVVYTRSRVQNAVSRILELYRRNGRYAANRRAQDHQASRKSRGSGVRGQRGAADRGRPHSLRRQRGVQRQYAQKHHSDQRVGLVAIFDQ